MSPVANPTRTSQSTVSGCWVSLTPHPIPTSGHTLTSERRELILLETSNLHRRRPRPYNTTARSGTNFLAEIIVLEKMESHDETGCQAPPEGPILCVNNCGFFGSAATMNMCSKCHKDLIMNQEHAKMAASSFASVVNGTSSASGKESVDAAVHTEVVEPKVVSSGLLTDSSSSKIMEAKAKEGPSRCNACCKRVGLTGFNCRCGNIFCAVHRYSDKHSCPFNYQTAARDAIAKANPVVKAEKLEKI